jgi:cytochrome c oxidase subunit 2
MPSRRPALREERLRKKRPSRKLAIVAMLAASLTCVAGQQPAVQQPAPEGNARTINVTARKFHFEPKVIRVRQGEHVTLAITAVDTTHGFQIKPLNINETLPKGQTVDVPIPTDRPGTYHFQCSHFCGLGHHGMKGTLIVEPRGQSGAGE